jgi:uncharacterized cupin superfamily protein
VIHSFVRHIPDPALQVGPGDLAVLHEGDRTTWTVHETLRKAYAITPHH